MCEIPYRNYGLWSPLAINLCSKALGLWELAKLRKLCSLGNIRDILSYWMRKAAGDRVDRLCDHRLSEALGGLFP